MDTETALRKILAEKTLLVARGVNSLSLFGSRAKGTARTDSDFDFAVQLDPSRVVGGLGFADIELELSRIVEAQVDLVAEPARKPRMQFEINRWRRRVF